MLDRQEFEALIQIINKAPMSRAEGLWVQQLMRRFEEAIVLQEAQEKAQAESTS
jgi:hypothetical protein